MIRITRRIQGFEERSKRMKYYEPDHELDRAEDGVARTLNRAYRDSYDVETR
jgi:hypothetical protein